MGSASNEHPWVWDNYINILYILYIFYIFYVYIYYIYHCIMIPVPVLLSMLQCSSCVHVIVGLVNHVKALMFIFIFHFSEADVW